ncbi:MAG TPA: alpha/beta hydrolase [Solirubrobacteraceae bacterium]|jgi:pimeloyl-ACP methyl ester carboxylesterase|nr:alpha/beta hydrolase [Solirubrobacteraceae bacterium]
MTASAQAGVGEAADPASFQRALGTLHTASLSSGPLRYRDHGSGVPVVFLAGLVLASGFWRRVVPALAQPIRAIVPDLPLGAHTIAMRPDADLSPAAIAALVPELLDTLGIGEAVIVGNDTGGVIAKLLATRHPERVSGLVLTPCECFENFLPPLYRYLQVLARVPGALWPLVQSMRFAPIRRLPIAFGRLTKRPLDKQAYDSFLTPGRIDSGVRRDTAKMLRAISRRYTVQADAELARFDRPALIAWANEDRVFPYRHAEALAETLPNARLISVADTYTYIPEDQPLVLAGHIDRFVGTTPRFAIPAAGFPTH